eukprot:CAMPEP_0168596034 /NCGR_PEP_ID=MMETSP0420-20121227/9805_1 /TAXON_ID=498008 /ORGANISM="Pessonella sp." /LENGTH=1034 /DNA_ID=CAMNT_0008632571 /DNA_START=35 /DNA_END=3136 /DNA_ORIENTATION=-
MNSKTIINDKQFDTSSEEESQDFTLLLDKYVLAKIVNLAGALLCGLVCKRWRTVPINFLVVKSTQRDTLPLIDLDASNEIAPATFWSLSPTNLSPRLALRRNNNENTSDNDDDDDNDNVSEDERSEDDNGDEHSPSSWYETIEKIMSTKSIISNHTEQSSSSTSNQSNSRHFRLSKSAEYIDSSLSDTRHALFENDEFFSSSTSEINSIPSSPQQLDSNQKSFTTADVNNDNSNKKNNRKRRSRAKTAESKHLSKKPWSCLKDELNPVLSRVRALEIQKSVWETDSLDGLIAMAPKLERIYLKSRRSDLWPRAVPGTLIDRIASRLFNLRTIYVSCTDAELGESPISINSLRHLRRLRRLTLRHVKICDIEALNDLALFELDLSHTFGLDSMLSGEAALPIASCVALKKLSLDARPHHTGVVVACDNTLLAMGSLLRCEQEEDNNIRLFVKENASIQTTMPNLEYLSMMFQRIDKVLALSAIPNVEHLYINGCEINCELDPLRKLTRLKTLELYCTRLKNPLHQLAVIGKLHSLRSLMLPDDVDDDGIEALQTLSNLEDLYSEATILTEKAVYALQNLDNLRYLHCAGATEKALELAMSVDSPLRRLRALDFGHRHNRRFVDDEYIEKLCDALPCLYLLDLAGARKPTTKCLSSLVRLKYLRHVNLVDAIDVLPQAFEQFSHLLSARDTLRRSASLKHSDDVAFYSNSAENSAHSVKPDDDDVSPVSLLPMEQLQTQNDNRRRYLARNALAFAAAALATAVAAQASPGAAAATTAAVLAAASRQASWPVHKPPMPRCTPEFPLDSWRACVQGARKHFLTVPISSEFEQNAINGNVELTHINAHDLSFWSSPNQIKRDLSKQFEQEAKRKQQEEQGKQQNTVNNNDNQQNNNNNNTENNINNENNHQSLNNIKSNLKPPKQAFMPCGDVLILSPSPAVDYELEPTIAMNVNDLNDNNVVVNDNDDNDTALIVQEQNNNNVNDNNDNNNNNNNEISIANSNEDLYPFARARARFAEYLLSHHDEFIDTVDELEDYL